MHSESSEVEHRASPYVEIRSEIIVAIRDRERNVPRLPIQPSKKRKRVKETDKSTLIPTKKSNPADGEGRKQKE
jgi:hypothetical protein